MQVTLRVIQYSQDDNVIVTIIKSDPNALKT